MYDNSHCVNYRIFKHSLCLERYLIDLIKRDRTILSRFRCGNHYLPIVASRYSNTTREMRLCNLQSLGDEFHYLFVCPTFRSDRILFIDKYFIERPNTQKMDQLFNSNNVQTLLNVFINLSMCKKHVMTLILTLCFSFFVSYQFIKLISRILSVIH